MSFPVPLEMFTAFLVTAKRRTYATQGDGATFSPLLPGSHQCSVLSFSYASWLLSRWGGSIVTS